MARRGARAAGRRCARLPSSMSEPRYVVFVRRGERRSFLSGLPETQRQSRQSAAASLKTRVPMQARSYLQPSDREREAAGMARVFITGSSDGLGRNAAKLLVELGHEVVLHARNEDRAREAAAAVPGAERTLIGDFASLAAVKRLAAEANELGSFDAVIHNAAVGYREKRRLTSQDGFSHVLAVNTLAPYALVALMHPPKRLVFVSSELHRRGRVDLADLDWERRPWNGTQAYSDTKLHDAMLAFALARALAVDAVERDGAGLGRHQDGRRSRDRRSRRCAPHAGLARRR